MNTVFCFGLLLAYRTTIFSENLWQGVLKILACHMVPLAVYRFQRYQMLR